ncbi:MAG: tyrosine--tRNA ligase [Candidatus Omnitrophota bacterium]|nr:MAG: tyrosine--tRNA ligase [Candidatus Omnitrophota bacterium]HDN97920.1 tyrosine--tRNA ligase [bacterium]
MDEVERQLRIIKRNTVEVIEEAELREKLKFSIEKNIPLRVKYGIDPTSPEIHLGHTVPIKKLKDFQMLGHKILFLIGDFTARIGDPTGRNETRPMLSPEEINENLSRYKEQIGKILDLDKTEFVYNSSWLSKINLEEFIKICSIFTIAQILEREDFSKRYRSGIPIALHEFIYPLLQGYDSVVLKADVEIGATEQKFNLLAGRTIQQAFNQPKQVVITMPILVGTDGKRKMSKTYSNHIPIDTTPSDMFGKVMSIPDGIMEEYFRILTDIPKEIYEEMIKKNPRDAKAFLAKEIVKEYFNEKIAEEAEKEFDRVFKEKKAPSEIPEYKVDDSLKEEDGKVNFLNLLVSSGLVSSKSEAKRLIMQKAVKIDGKTVDDPFIKVKFNGGEIIKVGKRRFLKIKI